jgi:hypothetical protein
MRKSLFSICVLALALAPACGGDDDGGGDDDTGGTPDAAPAPPDAAPPDASPCAAAGAVCGRVVVPNDFTGTPKKLFIGLYDALPPAGPPKSTLYSADLTSVTPGQALDVIVTDFPDTGSFHAYVVLYVEGGGTFVPVSGKDYVGETGAITFDPAGPVDLGDVALSLAP